MRARLIVTTIVMGGFALAAGTIALAGKPSGGGISPANHPDLRAIVPAHLQLVNQQQREILRFSNGISNTGGGPWALRPEPELGTAPVTTAIQEIRSSNAQHRCGTQPKPSDPCYTILQEIATTTFEYHEAHHHWHTADVARFEVRKGSPTGPVVGTNSIKVGFCLIDVYKLEDNAPTSEKTFWDCYTSFQGVSVGWADQYHQATDGQQLDLTGVPNATDYYLVTTTNPTGIFREQDATNNTEWVKFTLSGSGGGNRKITVTAHSPCENPGMCGERSTNRG
jgi:Lysyl oxidase